MLNYFAGIQTEILGTDDLNKVYQGTLIEHLVGQELLATQFKSLSAEVDYVVPIEGQLITVEVKSGARGKLKSLHMFMDLSPHHMAIRFYAGSLHITDAVTPGGKKYKLLNLPYYLVSQIENYLTWFKTQI